MREVVESITTWEKENIKVALATLVKVYGSAPSPLGSKMVINDQMGFTGSVSGGCVEANVIENALLVMKTGICKLVHYGIADETAWDLGLACGGEIEVFIEPFFHPELFSTEKTQVHDEIIRIVQNKDVGTVVTILSGAYQGEKLLFTPDGQAASDRKLLANSDLKAMAEISLNNQKSTKGQIIFDNEKVDLFVDFIGSQPALIIIGAVHIAVPLVKLANITGFDTIVMDPRAAFATEQRFPHADKIIVGWPAEKLQEIKINANTYIVFLSHDEKIDNPAMQIALRSHARYIGALGSRRTHQKRIENLLAMGVDEHLLDRIYAPIGLDIGAIGAEQIALSIMAEILAVKNGVC